MPTYPPNLLASLLETTNHLAAAEADDAVTKADLCKSLKYRLSLLIGKLVSAPTGASFRVFEGEALGE